MKYVCLDIGNVLCHVDSVSFLDKLSSTLNINIPEASRFLKRFQQLHDIGYTTMEDELKDQFGIKSPITIRDLVAHWNASITSNSEIIDMLNDLIDEVGNKPQIALLSNIGIEHATMMEDILSMKGFFEKSIKHFSCFVGARKPSVLYYQSFLWQYPDFKGCLYVDDLQENLDTGARFGFKPYKFDLNDSDYLIKIKDIAYQVLNP